MRLRKNWALLALAVSFGSLYIAVAAIVEPFCETELSLQQLVQKTQLAANVMKADLHQRVVVTLKAVVGIPMHALGLVAVAVAVAIQNACLPAQPSPAV